MKRLHLMLLAALLPLFAGCSIERSCLDFPDPIFDVQFGNCATLMCFPRSTVLHVGATYYTLNIPFYLLVRLATLGVLIVGCFGLRTADETPDTSESQRRNAVSLSATKWGRGSG